MIDLVAAAVSPSVAETSFASPKDVLGESVSPSLEGPTRPPRGLSAGARGVTPILLLLLTSVPVGAAPLTSSFTTYIKGPPDCSQGCTVSDTVGVIQRQGGTIGGPASEFDGYWDLYARAWGGLLGVHAELTVKGNLPGSASFFSERYIATAELSDWISVRRADQQPLEGKAIFKWYLNGSILGETGTEGRTIAGGGAAVGTSVIGGACDITAQRPQPSCWILFEQEVLLHGYNDAEFPVVDGKVNVRARLVGDVRCDVPSVNVAYCRSLVAAGGTLHIGQMKVYDSAGNEVLGALIESGSGFDYTQPLPPLNAEVPEGNTWTMLMTGFAAIAWWRRQRFCSRENRPTPAFQN